MHIGSQKKPPYVVWVSKTQLSWIGGGLKEVIQLDWSEGVLRDLEIINRKTLENLFHSFQELHNLTAGQVIVVVGEEMSFQAELPLTDETQVGQYLQMVPFEQLMKVTLPTAQSQIVYAVSEDLILPLVQLLQQFSFEVEAVLPQGVAQRIVASDVQFGVEYARLLDSASANITDHSWYLKPKSVESVASIRHADGKIFNTQLVLMLAFFGLLIVVLLFLLYSNGYLGGKTSPQPAAAGPSPLQVEQVAPTVGEVEPVVTPGQLTPTAATSSATPQTQLRVTITASPIQTAISIQVLNGSGAAGQAELVKAELNDLGFTVVEVGNGSRVSGNTLIFVSPAITQATRQALLTACEQAGLSPSIQESTELEGVDVRITTGS